MNSTIPQRHRPTMPKLSLCMITKNEEQDLPRCLESASPFVDEIVLVDTGSTDKTTEIAIGYGAKLIGFEWINDFSAARNESLGHATGDWILVLDADEIIAEKDFEKIRELITNNDADAYSLVQRNYTTDAKIFGWQPPDDYEECASLGFTRNPIVRLFKRMDGINFINAVHETVVPSLIGAGAKITESEIPIHHFGHIKSEGTRSRKRELYLGIGLEQIRKSPNDPRPRYEVAMIYKNTGREEQALEQLHKVAQLDPTYELVYCTLGEIYARNQDQDQAIKCYKKSIAIKPEDENAYINLSVIYFEQARVDDAIALLTSAIENNPKSAMAYNNLAYIFISQKNFSKAIEILKAAFARTGLSRFNRIREQIEQNQLKVSAKSKKPGDDITRER